MFSAGIDFQYSFEIFGSGSHDKIREWYQVYRETKLRILREPQMIGDGVARNLE